MSKWKKCLILFQYFGTMEIVNKLYEKTIIDSHRFRSGLIRDIPSFPVNNQENNIPQMQSVKHLSICYLVHFFYPDKAGGTERFVLNLAKEQQQLGNQVNVITLGRRGIDEYNKKFAEILYREYEVEGIPVTEVRYYKAPAGLYYKRLTAEDLYMHSFARYFIKTHSPDVIHCAYPQPFASFLRASEESKIPYIVTLTDFNILCHYATMVDKTGQFCNGCQHGERCHLVCRTFGIADYKDRYKSAAMLLNGAKVITAPSKFVKSVIEQEFPNITIEVVPHGIGTDFIPTKSINRTKKFIYAGTLSELKGIHLLIEAFKKVDGDISLSIYGEGNAAYKRKIKRLAAEDKRIKIEKALPYSCMAKMYQSSDCVVVPSIWYETYNFVLREALRCNCLTVASRIGAMPEAISEGKNGFMFDAGNSDALRSALEKARDFDWRNYEQKQFPSCEDEAKAYNWLYHNCAECYGKKDY